MIIPPNSSALSPPLFVGGIPPALADAWESIHAGYSSDDVRSTIETSGKDDGDPQVVPRGADATLGPVGETGTADAQAADDDAAPTGLPPDHRSHDKSDRGEQQGKARQVRVRDKRPPKSQRKSPPELLGETGTANVQAADDNAITGLPPNHLSHDNSDRGEQQGKARQVRVRDKRPPKRQRKSPAELLGETGTADAQAADDDAPTSDDKSDDDKSDKRGQQSNGGKKAGTHANKPKDGEKKRGNEAINDGHKPSGREERPARKE